MSTQITEAFVKQFNSTVFHLSQQRGSRLRGSVRNESQKGKSQFFDRIGLTEAVLKSSRHSDTPIIDTPHSRRRVTLNDYSRADLIDDADRIRLLIDPASDYVKSFMFAFGRKMDQNIIDAADGSAYSGEEGSTTVSHPNSQKVASVSAGAGANLNVQALRRAKLLMDAAEVDEMINRHIAITASCLENLLSETSVTSSDFNSVKALVQGELNTFLGFNFHRLQLLNAQASALSFNQTTGAVGSGSGDANTYRRVVCWAEDGLLLSIGQDAKARVSERDDKEYSTQAYMSMSIGATRLEEEKVVIILADD